MQKKYYITGISGTGKSTLARELNRRGFTSFDLDIVDDLCHWQNKETKAIVDWHPGIGIAWLEKHEWICDANLLKKLIADTNRTVFAFGMPANQEEILPFFDKTFLLQSSRDILLHRLNTREGEDEFARDKSEQDWMFSWQARFEKEMFEKGAIPINTEIPVNKVADKILNHLNY